MHRAASKVSNERTSEHSQQALAVRLDTQIPPRSLWRSGGLLRATSVLSVWMPSMRASPTCLNLSSNRKKTGPSIQHLNLAFLSKAHCHANGSPKRALKSVDAMLSSAVL
eukprot:2567202-Rhodomonas_salina.2